jgi:hypothetical protein
MEVSRRSWIIGEGNGTLWRLVEDQSVLVYKMLWDQKKILNINLWRIIRLNMRPATGLCSHISLERILVTQY